MARKAPLYFEPIIAAFRTGHAARHVHLGHWDAPPTSRGHDEFARAQQALDDVLLDLARLADNASVLDVGCGLGGTLERIDRTRTGMHLVGANVDCRQLAICRSLTARPVNRVAWVAADGCDLPFAAESFDAVLCIEAMFHFPSRRRFFAETGRLLRPGGVLVASDIVARRPSDGGDASVRRLERAIVGAYGPWPDLWCADADHRALGAAAGLACTDHRDATEHTLPSHLFTVPDGIGEAEDPGDPLLRGALALRRLHRRGDLRYLYLRFEKLDGAP